jgi:hypothetical protein
VDLHVTKREGTSRVTWEIEQVGDSCKLTVTHDQLLETGETLTTPGSLLYAMPPA